MTNHSRLVKIFAIAIVTISFAWSSNRLLLAQEQADNTGVISQRRIPETKKGTVLFGKDAPANPADKKEDLTALQQQARQYRRQGFEAQKIGNIESALTFYQKAVELDPLYAMAYNDLGIIYEAQGRLQEAEKSYLQAMQIDPDYLATYSNLALFYESQRDLASAAACWKKRANLGSSEDPWTQKAKQRYEDIRVVISGRPIEEDIREREVVGLLKDVAHQKDLQNKDNKELARTYFEQAKLRFKKGDEVTALKKAIDAKQLDPTNKEIQEFIDKVQIRLLSK